MGGQGTGASSLGNGYGASQQQQQQQLPALNYSGLPSQLSLYPGQGGFAGAGMGGGLGTGNAGGLGADTPTSLSMAPRNYDWRPPTSNPAIDTLWSMQNGAAGSGASQLPFGAGRQGQNSTQQQPQQQPTQTHFPGYPAPAQNPYEPGLFAQRTQNQWHLDGTRGLGQQGSQLFPGMGQGAAASGQPTANSFGTDLQMALRQMESGSQPPLQNHYGPVQMQSGPPLGGGSNISNGYASATASRSAASFAGGSLGLPPPNQSMLSLQDKPNYGPGSQDRYPPQSGPGWMGQMQMYGAPGGDPYQTAKEGSYSAPAPQQLQGTNNHGYGYGSESDVSTPSSSRTGKKYTCGICGKVYGTLGNMVSWKE